MIILDTNVVSEAIKLQADYTVLRWFDRQAIDTLYLTTINLAELFLGVELLPEGKRKKTLNTDLIEWIAKRFGGRILSFDQLASMAYGPLIAKARAKGFQISVTDGQIAAIASVHNYAVATRDTAPFEAAGIKVINPWNE